MRLFADYNGLQKMLIMKVSQHTLQNLKHLHGYSIIGPSLTKSQKTRSFTCGKVNNLLNDFTVQVLL